ncbi:hypothetical protein KM918_20905 [Priestia megaterium]|uniref:hypothetical protein n=1 Tax=Priestia megaterium TaxID=1404 RepID=UPI001C213D19|nr:hypothetical protein [Priestia megaterium]MBU8689777.1 hypothetical protein [Priestia megaterium]
MENNYAEEVKYRIINSYFSLFLVISFLAVMQKPLSIVENIFTCLVVTAININASWVIEEELKFVKTTDGAIKYAAFLLKGSIIIMNLVIQVNTLRGSNSISKAFLIILAFLLEKLPRHITFLSLLWDPANSMLFGFILRRSLVDTYTVTD